MKCFRKVTFLEKTDNEVVKSHSRKGKQSLKSSVVVSSPVTNHGLEMRYTTSP